MKAIGNRCVLIVSRAQVTIIMKQILVSKLPGIEMLEIQISIFPKTKITRKLSKRLRCFSI